MNILIAILLSYLVGSLPFAFILTKALKNIDLRKVGSGNIGATNAMRAVGFKIGIVALVLDIAKGIIPIVFLTDKITPTNGLPIDTVRVILGLAVICGHNWTILLKFKGGKGIATSFGVLIGLAIKNALIAKVLAFLALIWTATFIASGYVSLASIVSAIFLPIFLSIFGLDSGLICFGIIMTTFSLYRHKSNIRRLLQHKENRFDIKSKILSLKKKALS